MHNKAISKIIARLQIHHFDAQTGAIILARCYGQRVLF